MAVSNLGRVSEVDSRGSAGLVVAVVLGWLLWCKCEVSHFRFKGVVVKLTSMSVRHFEEFCCLFPFFGRFRCPGCILRIGQGVSSSPEVKIKFVKRHVGCYLRSFFVCGLMPRVSYVLRVHRSRVDVTATVITQRGRGYLLLLATMKMSS